MPAEFPMQPLEWDDEGIVRFRRNRIVYFLLDSGTIDLNVIARHHAGGLFETWEMEQLYQLIGYSVSGFGDCGFREATVAEADAAAEALAQRPHNGGVRGVDFPCEECGAKTGSALDNGFYRCNTCGYPGK